MRPVASIAVLSIGVALVAVSLAFWPAWPLGVMGAVLAISVLVDRRYRGRAEPPVTGWEPTTEKFLDEETGQVMQVWYHPGTGQRDYRPG
ncbi:hypothetical protein [Novosphingobium rosa]|uniref:hypothetical protein n=1 Tax=Novosphingobium rosa TaxID=76978 RepID=UPI0008326C5B|nr:hypothetical protein [Novosphingobium rosa]